MQSKRRKPSPLFYACYLLISLAPRSQSTIYVGSTPNPIRRLRQHNREIAGGAVRTGKRGPWEMAVVVYGFPNKFSALQFEWAWQNPHKSRHFKETPDLFKGKQNERFLNAKLHALALMFHLEQYKRWPLHLHFNADTLYRKLKAKKDLPCHVRVTIGSLSTLPYNDGPFSEEGMEIREVIDDISGSSCTICGEPLDTDCPSSWLGCTSDTCHSKSHILCLSQSFLQSDTTSSVQHLIPLQGNCPSCDTELKWGNLIQKMRSRCLSFGNSKADIIDSDMIVPPMLQGTEVLGTAMFFDFSSDSKEEDTSEKSSLDLSASDTDFASIQPNQSYVTQISD